MKKRYTSKRRYGTRKRRIYKKKTLAAKTARRMQAKSLSFVKKRYTAVFPLKITTGLDSLAVTISHIGGVNTNGAVSADTFTLGAVNPDNQTKTDMDSYQFFRITGVAFKIFFPEGTDTANTAVQWSMGYSSSQVIKPTIQFDRL